MAIIRTINCAVCGKTEVEKEQNIGWPGWSCIQGVALNNEANPNLCPDCTARVMQFIDGGSHGMD